MLHQKYFLLLSLTLLISIQSSTSNYNFSKEVSCTNLSTSVVCPTSTEATDSKFQISHIDVVQRESDDFGVSYQGNHSVVREDNSSQNRLMGFSATTRSGTSHKFKVTKEHSNLSQSRSRMSSLHQPKEYADAADGADWFEGN